MKECFYYKDGKKVNNVQDIIHDFFKDNYQLKNAAIFSAEEIQDSTVKKIKNILGANSYKQSTKTEVLKVITEPNPGLFTRLGIETKTGRLSPEYIEGNRIYQYVIDNLDKLNSLPPDFNVGDLIYTPEKLEALKAFTELHNIPDNKLITLLSEIEDTISYEEKTKHFGTFLHKIISLKVLEKEYKGDVMAFIKDAKNAEIFGEYPIEEWYDKLDAITDEIVETVKKTGVPISEIFLMSNVDTGNTQGKAPIDAFGAGMRGKIDLIAVDKQGDAHIFEIKISKTKYTDWDKPKLLTLDWQLAMYRQLLGQHININKTMLYVIPIWVSSTGNPSGISVQDFINRKSTSKSGLNDTGKITHQANLILPRKVFVDYDPARTDILSEQLTKLIPDYTIKTGIEDYDVDHIMENARKRYEKEKVWKKWNNFEDIPGLKKGYMESQSEEEFRTKIEAYVKHVKTQVNRNVSILKDAIISAIKTETPIKTNSYDSEKDITVNHLLKEYLNEEWDVVDIPEALAMGLIVLKNTMTGNVNIISLSINQFYATYKNAPEYNYGDLEILKSFLFVNMFHKELLPLGNGKLAQIMVYNPINNQVYSRNSFAKFEDFKKRMYARGLTDQLTLIKDNVSGIDDIALYNLDVNFRRFDGSGKKEIDEIFAKFRNTDLDQIDLDQLLDIQGELFKVFPDYKNKTINPSLNFDDPKEVLLALLQVAIVSKSQMNLYGDFQKLSKYSLGFSDFYSLVAALYTDNQSKYDKEGKRIQGIVQGLVWTTPDWVASKDLQSINKIMSTGNQHIGEAMVRTSEIIYGHTKKLYKIIKFSETNRNVVGMTQDKYKDFWLLNDDKKIRDDFKTKNPYKDDMENILDDAHKEYLKNILFIINTWKFEIPDKEAADIDPNSLESVSKNPKLAKAIEDGTYFEMPLIRREEVSKYAGVFTSPGKLWQDKIKPFMGEINDYIDSRELLPENLDAIEKQKMGFYEMYDAYGRQTAEFKAKSIEKHSVHYFETNLDTIAHRVAFNKIRKKIMDKRLPIINAYIWWMKLLAGKENTDISNQLKYVADQISLSVYDEPIIDEEFKDVAKVVGVVKSITTAALLAFRPALFAKEMSIGLFKGITLASTQLYGKDQFTVTDLIKAYGKLMTINNKFASEFNLIDRLNHFYRFANMDTNTIAQKLQTDRRGLFRGLGRYMYMMNTIPDYYNRLSIFLAKMIHDGSYEAHSLVDGVFTYDPRKDKRFEYYLANRDKYMSNEEYIPAVGDEKYNKQRRHYLLLLEQLKNEYNGKATDFSESLIVNKAYSEVERSSLKSFTDMAYGYYDKDAQSQANNTWWGMAWLHFMQFWPGKMKMWFAQPTDESPMGAMIHDFIIDKDGVKRLQYLKTIVNEDGSISTIDTDEDTGDPKLKWTKAPYEGLYYAVVGTLKDIATLNFSKVKNADERNKKVLLALADGALIFILLKLVKAFLDAYILDNGTEGLSGTAVNMMASVNKKVLNEYNAWNSTLGAVNTEPIFLSWGKKVGGDMWSAISGDKEIMDVMTRNVGAAEVFKW